MTAVDDAGRREHAQGVGVALDMKLIARRRVERATAVRADLGADPAVAQERERTPCRCAAAEVEMQPPVAGAAQMQAPGRVEQRGQLGSAIALALGRDRG